MTRVQKSRSLYKTPFSKAYWRDAALELRDTKILVFAALMIALRLALKLVYIPLAPNLRINTAFIANAIGAMVFGPVMAALCALITDFLGWLMNPVGIYFPPLVLTEIAGSVIFALFLYRVKLTPTRVMLSRFCICLFVNILLNTPLMMLYYEVVMGGKMYVLTVPHILKNLFMFPIESVVLTLLLSVIQPITYRMGLTYSPDHALKFSKKQIAMLALLFVFGTGCVTGYLSYHYQNTSLTTGYSAQEVVDRNKAMQEIIVEETGGINGPSVSIIETAYKQFLGSEVTYTVAYYAVEPKMADTPDGSMQIDQEFMESLWSLKKTPASKHEALTRAGTAVIQINEKTGVILSFEYTPAA